MRDKGERGVCGAGNELALARAALHFWEEPPLSGQRGSGALFFVHCPLGCVYCQNRAIAQGDFGQQVSVERLAELCLELQAQGALNVNCVTPTHYTPQVAQAVRIARESGLAIPVVWNTSGYELADVIDWLDGTVDVYLTDFKYYGRDIARAYSRAADYREVALAALDRMVATAGATQFDYVDDMPRMTKGVVVRHLLLPGGLDDSKRVIEMLFARYGNSVEYSIMNQYTPVITGRDLERFPELGAPANPDDYERLLDFADALGIEDYFWQEGPAAKESFIPAWDGTGLM